MSGIWALPLQFSAGEGHQVVLPVIRLLKEYGTQSFFGGISFQPEWFLEICEDKYGGHHASHLQFLKRFQGVRRKFYFLGLQLAGFSFQEIVQGFGYLRVAFDEPSEESCHSGKTPYFGIRFRRSHLRYRLEVSRTWFHPLG